MTTAQAIAEFTAAIALHYGPGPHPDGSPQAVHAGGQMAFDLDASAPPAPEADWRAYAASPAARLPEHYRSASDGGPGPALQYHGARRAELELTHTRPVFLQPDSAEAAGYARGLIQMKNQAGYVYTIRRAPGKAVNLDARITDLITEDAGDPDTYITQHAPALRAAGISYVYFTHPTFSGAGQQDVLVSLDPARDLKILKQRHVAQRTP